ncbi:hypothetical protein [Cyanobacterium sp. Dongsha4]|uniref:hypothetical protein n=1 Tax=Cyanobacterium sp. DS4 TaxID=2878255 RepID=UPI002E819760|nr:hypothetical protein [Cyanobacterium sp. Dongsha4]WVK99028.1 hypothetical protein Dongsha4_09965 [Cyanobacterium sp. Dongsha4]
MQMSNQNTWRDSYLLSMTKSFLIWNLTLTVCFLVVGFPLVVILMTVGVLAAVVLQSVFPASAIVLVSSGMLGVTLSCILFSSIILTLKGVHPNEVKWLGWLQDNDKVTRRALYASCPLTCSITQY